MYAFLRSYFVIAVTILMISCASTQTQTVDGDIASGEAGSYKFDAWRLNSSAEFESINVLLRQVDQHIEMDANNAATDKLERILRIKPQYAPAWSRLSWLSLQTGAAKRSVQMAKRSNSLAYSDPELQLLNWQFIRDASKLLNDEVGYNRASQKIDSLKAF